MYWIDFKLMQIWIFLYARNATTFNIDPILFIKLLRCVIKLGFEIRKRLGQRLGYIKRCGASLVTKNIQFSVKMKIWFFSWKYQSIFFCWSLMFLITSSCASSPSRISRSFLLSDLDEALIISSGVWLFTRTHSIIRTSCSAYSGP